MKKKNLIIVCSLLILISTLCISCGNGFGATLSQYGKTIEKVDPEGWLSLYPEVYVEEKLLPLYSDRDALKDSVRDALQNEHDKIAADCGNRFKVSYGSTGEPNVFKDDNLEAMQSVLSDSGIDGLTEAVQLMVQEKGNGSGGEHFGILERCFFFKIDGKWYILYQDDILSQVLAAKHSD